MTIKDDDNWEPDRDFFVHLYDKETGQALPGKDTITRVTIIDDDKPGYVAFDDSAKSGIIKVAPSESEDVTKAEIKLIRKNGSDGVVTVYWETQDLGAKTGKDDEYAKPNIDYEPVENGKVVFDKTETDAAIVVNLLKREGERNESFGIKLTKIEPEAAKLSKKDFVMVNIVTNTEEKKR